jgi:hypothetical protein
MGYYVRVLSTSAELIPLSALQLELTKNKLRAKLSVEAGVPERWEQLILRHARGPDIAAIERNPVEDGSLGSNELAEFADEVTNCKPASAAKWLQGYFRRVRCIYAFQVLSGADYTKGWDILGAIKNRIWASAPSIIQADAEGFSNEEGYHIVWQFKDSVSGSWWMGVLRDARWVHFQMDLGNPLHREAFWRGEVPSGAKFA